MTDNPVLFLFCERELDSCIEDENLEFGCFCCKGLNNCNTEEFYFSKLGIQSTSVPFPQSTPVFPGPTTSPTHGKGMMSVLVQCSLLLYAY